MQELEGRVAVVTGAASGIGEALVRRFAAAGMDVVAADIDADGLERVVSELEAGGAQAVGVPTDVSDAAAITALRDAAVDRFGTAHVVCNNAGVVSAGGVADLSVDDWRWVLDVDLWSVIHGVRTFLPLLREQGEGHIVSTASVAGLQAAPNIGPYNVAKFGVVAVMETTRRELQAEGSAVGASVLCPGAINTRIVDSDRNRPASSVPDPASAEASRMFKERAGTMLATRGKSPAEVADLVHDAVTEDRFWIITHEAWLDVMSERAAEMRSSGQLNSRFGG